MTNKGHRLWLAVCFNRRTKQVLTQKFSVGTHQGASRMTYAWATKDDLVVLGVVELIHPAMEYLFEFMLRLFRRWQWRERG